MPNYKTHSYFNIIFIYPFVLLILYYFFSPDLKKIVVFSMTFFYSTFFMSPDLDQAYKIKIFSLRGFLNLPFRLYSRLFHHRGLSHNILWGSITRIAWLSAIGFLIFFCFKIPFNQKGFSFFFQKNRFDLVYGFVGIFCADFFHVFLDILIKK